MTSRAKRGQHCSPGPAVAGNPSKTARRDHVPDAFKGKKGIHSRKPRSQSGASDLETQIMSKFCPLVFLKWFLSEIQIYPSLKVRDTVFELFFDGSSAMFSHIASNSETHY